MTLSLRSNDQFPNKTANKKPFNFFLFDYLVTFKRSRDEVAPDDKLLSQESKHRSITLRQDVNEASSKASRSQLIDT